jgi:glutamate-1-semialdehyde 2,1-aminomutase
MRRERSIEWRARGEAITPGGSQTLSKQASRLGPAGPAFATRGCGAVVYDVDGNDYIDWVAALGVLTLGHDHPHIREAIERQLRDGTIFSLPHTLECELAERLCAMVPCASVDGMARWTKTASEACAGAIRIARLASGRQVVLVARPGYHGWHDWFCVTQPFHDGIPPEFGQAIRTFDYNNIASLEQAIDRAGRDAVAAVILEPMRDVLPEPGYLEYLRRRTSDVGALLIFDETLLGFRLARAGGQEYFGVRPDLAVFGKALGGGLPLACIVGGRALMRHALIVSSTLGGECLALAAARAVLDLYEAEPVIQRLWDHGRRFVAAFEANARGLPVQWTGAPVRPYLRWDDEHRDRLGSLFVTEMMRRGVLVHADVVNASAAFSRSHVLETETALEQSLAAVRAALKTEAPALTSATNPMLRLKN